MSDETSEFDFLGFLIEVTKLFGELELTQVQEADGQVQKTKN